MNFLRLAFVLCCGPLFATAATFAQGAAAPLTVPVVPRLVRYSGSVANAPSGAGVVELRFAAYERQSGGEPLWQETQQVPLDANAKYSVLLGAATPGGMPLDLSPTDEHVGWGSLWQASRNPPVPRWSRRLTRSKPMTPKPLADIPRRILR
jgi:hypothetical protein